MSALGYLLVRRLKNRLRALVRSPGQLIGTLLLAAVLILVFVAGNLPGDEPAETLRDARELYALALALFLAMFVLGANNGLSRGVSLFSMADVNMLFSSPLSSRRVLVYGLIQQLGTSLLAGLFLLFQYAWLHDVYGVGGLFMAVLLVAYAMVIFCAQLTAMAGYIFCAGHPRRRTALRAILFGLTAACALYVAVRAYLGENVLTAAVAAANGWPVALFPVAGWMQTLLAGAGGGDWLLCGGMLLLTAGYCLLLARLIAISREDYYEDVLQAAETAYSAVTAAREGKATEVLPSQVKVGKTGLGGGEGASALYYKHRLETRRARRFVLDTMGLVMLATSSGFAVFTRESLLAVFMFSTYMQFFSTAMGRWTREMLLPYVYLMPESPFRKLLWCLRETADRIVLDALLLTVALTPLMGLSLVEAVAFFVARVSFGGFFTAVMLLTERLFGGLHVKWLVFLLMVLLLVFLLIPGIALTVVANVYAPGFLTEDLRMLLIPALCNVPIALAAVFASRNILDNVEMNIR